MKHFIVMLMTIILITTALNLGGCCEDCGDPTCPDAMRPSAITTLTAQSAAESSITLTWIATGDDVGNGQADEYDLRFSSEPDTTEYWWENATMMTNSTPLPSASGSVESFTVTGLAPCTEYFFAVKTADEATNWSLISNIHQISTTTAGVNHLSANLDYCRIPTWSPNSDRLAFTSYNPNYYGIVILSAEGAPISYLSPPDSIWGYGHPAWSPDGEKLACTSVSTGSLLLVPIAGGTVEELPLGDDLYASLPAWSPDGSQIAFGGYVGVDSTGLWIIATDGSSLVQLVDNLAYPNCPTWSPDGSTIAFDAVVDDLWNIWTVPATGGAPTQLTTNGGGDPHRASV